MVEDKKSQPQPQQSQQSQQSQSALKNKKVKKIFTPRPGLDEDEDEDHACDNDSKQQAQHDDDDNVQNKASQQQEQKPVWAHHFTKEELLGRYEPIRELGRGSYGVVYEGKSTWNNEKVGMKKRHQSCN